MRNGPRLNSHREPGARINGCHERTALRPAFVHRAQQIVDDDFLVFAIVVSFGAQTPHFRLDASSYSLVLENDEALEYYRVVRERNGSDDYLMVTYTPGAPLFDAGVLRVREAPPRYPLGWMGLCARASSCSSALSRPRSHRDRVELKRMDEIPDDIVERVTRDYPGELGFEVLRLIEGLEFAARVIRSVLYLADGDFEALQRYARRAEQDARDVIFWAEYEEHDAQKPRRARSMAEPFG